MTVTGFGALTEICRHFDVTETDLLSGDPAGFPTEAAAAGECLELVQLWWAIRDPEARRRCLNMLRSSAAASRSPGVAAPLEF